MRFLISCCSSMFLHFFATGQSTKKTDVNSVVYPTSLNKFFNSTFGTFNFTLNSTVGTISYDSSRNFTKWIFPTNRRKKATKTSATNVLSTKTYIEDDDSAISINKSKKKTVQPTIAPTSTLPTADSTLSPTQVKTQPTFAPTKTPPTASPSKVVRTTSSAPIKPSMKPSMKASIKSPTSAATFLPSKAVQILPTKTSTKTPSAVPTTSPTKTLTVRPTIFPSKAVDTPTAVPSILPSNIVRAVPSISPTKKPSLKPSLLPSKAVPTLSKVPSKVSTPTVQPSTTPSKKASNEFSSVPTGILLPSARPTSTVPSLVPSQIGNTIRRQSVMPSAKPSAKPSLGAVKPPSRSPSRVPSNKPVATPTTAPDSFKYSPGKKIMTGTVNLYNIYFGYFQRYPLLDPSQQTSNLVNYFSANIGSSSWYKTVTTYYQVNDDGSRTYASASVVLKKSVVHKAQTDILNVFDSEIGPMIVDLINAGQLPVDENGIYNVIFRGAFTFKGWLQDADLGGWCGFHSEFATIEGYILKYTVQGDPSTGPVNSRFYCQGSAVFPTANGNTGADSIVNILAHEIAETVTDYDDAWNENLFEIGDKCVWDFLLGNKSDTSNSNVLVGNKRFLLQSLYRVSYGCVLSCC